MKHSFHLARGSVRLIASFYQRDLLYAQQVFFKSHLSHVHFPSFVSFLSTDIPVMCVRRTWTEQNVFMCKTESIPCFCRNSTKSWFRGYLITHIDKFEWILSFLKEIIFRSWASYVHKMTHMLLSVTVSVIIVAVGNVVLVPLFVVSIERYWTKCKAGCWVELLQCLLQANLYS